MKHRTLRPVAMVVSVLCFSLSPFACKDAVINTASTTSGGTSSPTSASSTTGAGGHESSSSSSSSSSGSATSMSTSSSTSTGMTCDPDDPSCHPQLLCGTHLYQ